MPADATYEIDCRCGATVRGSRLSERQTVPCAGCGQSIFVLPTSPLPEELLGSLATGTAPELPALKLAAPVRFWVGPVAAAVIALAVVGVVIGSIVRSYRPATDSVELTESATRKRHSACMDSARSAIAEGSYRTAANDLGTAVSLQSRLPQLATAEPRLLRLYRQVALLADLLPESIEEIMRHALGQSDAEWQAVFRERYFNKAVLFDASIFRDASGRYHLDYQLDAGGLAGEWDLQKLELLRHLPLQRPQRLFLGVRLAEIARISRDRWIVRPLSDGGVLITDESLLAGLSVAADHDLLEVVRRQAGWNVDE